MILLLDLSGPKRRQCDARCFGAKDNGHCSCICNGKNHSVGLKQALKNVEEIFMGPITVPTITVTRRAKREIARMHEQKGGEQSGTYGR